MYIFKRNIKVFSLFKIENFNDKLIIPFFILFSFIYICCTSKIENNKVVATKIIKDSIVKHKYFSKNDFIIRLSKYSDTCFLNRFNSEIVKFEKADSMSFPPKNAILFIGSSSIRKWKTLKDDMYPLSVLNRGFGGSTIAECVWFFHRIVKPYNPSKIVFYAGENDLTEPNRTPNDIFECFKIFAEMSKCELPETKIYFISIKHSPSRIKIDSKIDETNDLVKYYAKTNNIEFVDIRDVMKLKNGKLNASLFLKDKLHLNKYGYNLWTKTIKTALLK